MTYEQIRYERRDGVAWIRLHRPDKLNALTTPMALEILAALQTAEADSAMRCVIITGEGRGFCAGQDLQEFPAGQMEGFDISEHLRSGYHRLVPALVGSPLPVVAGVNGVAAGAGLSLALACDVRIASDRASFMQAFVRIGLIPDSGGTWLLPRAVGWARALELSISGRTVDVEEALQVGLVHRVVPADRFDVELTDYAARLAALPTPAIGATKRLLAASAGSSLQETLEREAIAQAEHAGSPDFVEGVTAFQEKRAPRFTER